MKNELSGKKLLILSGSHNEVDLVRRAKELGVYTIVTDYYDTDKSPAKLIADEYWNISWNDTGALAKKCIETGVDGVTGGYSEFVVEAVIRLCKELDLPCYCTMEQLDITRDKVKFKEACRKNGVPVVHEYASVDDVDSYPVIVKPVDRAGSIGISIAKDKAELVIAYEYAMEMSVCKKVIIEDYISNGRKFDVFYSAVNGKIAFISSCDTINAKKNGFEKVIQSGWTFPSKYEDEYLKNVDSAMRAMLSDIQIKNGYIFFSGFAIPEPQGTKYVFFESGFRLSGGHLHSYIKEKYDYDLRDIFITHALTGNSFDILTDEAVKPNLKCLMVNYYAKGGTIKKISGYDEIEKLPDFTFMLQVSQEGTQCQEGQAILTKIAMFHFCNDTAEALRADLDICNRLFSVIGEDGQDLIYDRMDSDEILAEL